MRATLIPDLLTPCTALEFMRAVRSGLETLTGKTPSREFVAILTAQCALESGRWKSMHRNNPGNIKASESYEYLYCQFRCNEVIHGKVEWFDPPHAQCNFRAFYDLETGVIDYLRFLMGRKRYAAAWVAAERGDAVGFVRALKLGGYFTADEAPYTRSVVSLFNEYLRMQNQPERDTEPPTDHQNEAQAIMAIAPDPERLLHVAAIQAMALGNEGMWDAVREERNRNLREE